MAEELEERDRRILEFERVWRKPGAKEEAIRTTFRMSAPRYYQLLNMVIELPAAVRFDPMLIRHLQSLRDRRTAQRASRTFAVAKTEQT